MKFLNNIVIRLRLRRGLAANINTATTKATAISGELHFTTDTKQIFIYNDTENVEIPHLPAATDTLATGTFTTADGKTVTVKNGIITSIV